MATLFQKISYSVVILLTAVLISFIGSRLYSQDDPEKPVSIQVNTDLVNVFATVRDKKGTFIKDLAQEDFIVKEDGKKQPITNFHKEVDLPLTIGMIIDASPSMQRVMSQLQIASKAFFDSMVDPKRGDQIFVMKYRDLPSGNRSMQYDGQIEMMQDLTSDPAAIAKAANLIAWEGVGGTPTDADFETMLSDAVIIATSQRMMMLPPGRKALIILGDGFHAGNHLDNAVDMALESDTLIYTVHIYDSSFDAGGTMGGGGGGGGMLGGGRTGGMLGGSGGGGFGRFGGGGGGFGGGGFGGGGFGRGGMMNTQNASVYATNLQTLSNKTGGSYFEYTGSGKEGIDQIYGEIEEELRSIYSLGYVPPESKKKGCRKIKVEVKKKGLSGLTVNAREKYCPYTE
jgi:VWFA-related protein